MDFIKEKINVTLDTIKRIMEPVLLNIEFEYVECEYKKNNTPPAPDAGWKKFAEGERLTGVDKHYWMHFTLDAVPAQKDKELLFMLNTGREGAWDANNPQGLVFLNGTATQALDTNHTWLGLEFDKAYDVYIYFYTGREGNYFDVLPKLVLRDTLLYQLYYDILTPYEVLGVLPADSYDAIRIKNALEKASFLLDWRNKGSEAFYQSVRDTIAFLKEEFYEKECGNVQGEVSCIGHTHIDVAWLWTVAQTREKAERSFSTVLNLMRRYPDYKFMSSQPQLYQHVKEANPELYEEIKQRVKEGRWEVEGAMWLEADCNLISGESMVRQILHGKKFMKEEFGVESKILWLPDVFGYSAALPQILQKSGVDRFFTTKIYWNETNSMPNDIFMWKGIDGTEIMTCFIRDYVRRLNPESMYRAWDQFKDKNLTDRIIATVGFGDGGGGTTPEMMEYYNRLKHGLPGMPKVMIDTANNFYDHMEKDFANNTKELRTLPKWDGELYLELHRGTYTTMAKNKRSNRKSELLYQEAETLSVLDSVLLGGKYDQETFDRNMINILLNQFHDIIPGSSIKEVYEVTDAEYEQILSDANAIKTEKLSAICKNVKTEGGILVYNPTPYAISDYVEADGAVYYADAVPAHGYKVISDAPTTYGVTVSDRVLENDLIRVTFDDHYQIISVFDKEAGRETIAEGAVANRLELYEDYPKCWDAWEISEYYQQKMWICDDVTAVEKTERGVRVTRKYGNSEIVQEIAIRNGSKRIDFITKVDWHEDHVFLKAAFPVDIRTQEATYDIQFGNLKRPTHRNTSWDRAKFEVCAHKWGDLSEGNYGVSLLNDCKYGYSAYENVISLSLLKSAKDPNPVADMGMHEFTYSFYPHTGDFREGQTVQEAYLLNMPLTAQRIEKTEGTMPEVYSLVSCNRENVVVETVKKTDADDSVIVRLFDCYNQKTEATVTFGFDVKKVSVCNLMEEIEYELPVDGRSVTVPVKNFEIVTLKVEA